MIRCPTCNALHNPGEPCPGCLVSLGLERPPEPERGDRKAMLGLAVGLVLGLSVSVTAIGAMATWMGHSAQAAGEDAGSVAAERQALEDERAALEEERGLLHGEREKLAIERQRLDDAAFRADRAVSEPRLSDPVLKDAEAAARAAERRAREAEGGVREAESAARRAEEAARAAAERAAADADAARMAAEKRAGESARQAALEARLTSLEGTIEAKRRAEEAAVAASRVRAEALGLELPLGVACNDLVALEPRAMLGKLTDRERDCLEQGRGGSLGEEASRLLVTDAFSANDEARWVTLAEFHMEHIRADLETAYKLALHAWKKRDAAATLRWSDTALARRTGWSGATYTARVGTLYKMRYLANLQEHGADDPHTRVAATEWREFLTAVGKPLPPELGGE